jgi:hypothetical protein
MQAPQPEHAFSITSGKKAPPMRDRNRIACSAQASRQIMQKTPDRAKHSSEMAAMWISAAPGGA